MADELAAVPGKVSHVFASEEDDAGLVAKSLRQQKPRAVGEHGRVGWDGERLGSLEMVVTGRDGHGATLLQHRREKSGDAPAVVGSGKAEAGEQEDGKDEAGFHRASLADGGAQ